MAVIGAGPSGLVTVKELLEEGHEVLCFERASALGGVFRFGEDDGVVWESCRLTSSGLLTAFSDFPVPPDRIEHMRVGEYLDYLKRYCREFDVEPHIRFGTTVEAVVHEPKGAWRVSTTDADGSRRDESFDAVAVCCGRNQNPHRPSFAGQDSYSGQIMHSAEYRRPEQTTGRRVLIVGAGESGADLAAEISEHASETVLSLRRGVGVLPRTRRGHPNDWQTSRITNSSAHWVFQTRNPADGRKRDLYRVIFFPLVLADKLVQTVARVVGWLRHFRSLVRLRRRGPEAVSETRISLETSRLTKQLLAESGGTLHEQLPTKSDEFIKAIAAGRSRRAGPITRIDGRRVILEDGGEFEPDLVILCTGFELRLPFLTEELAREPRYLQTFAPSVGASLAFIGMARPAFGAIPPIAELQARWFALLVGGKAELPPEAEMRASIDRLTGFRRHYFRLLPGSLDHVVDYTSLCDELASEIGCKPSLEAIAGRTRRFRLRFYAAPFVAAQYRLLGPHAKPELATEVIEGLPVAHPAHELGAFYLRWRLSRALHRMLGAGYEPKLVLR